MYSTNRTVPIIHAKAIIANIRKAQDQQKKQYDQGRRTQQDKYKPGDLVARKNMKMGGFPKERWTGPYVITKAINKEETTYYQIYNKQNPRNILKANIIGDLRKWYSK